MLGRALDQSQPLLLRVHGVVPASEAVIQLGQLLERRRVIRIILKSLLELRRLGFPSLPIERLGREQNSNAVLKYLNVNREPVLANLVVVEKFEMAEAVQVQVCLAEVAIGLPRRDSLPAAIGDRLGGERPARARRRPRVVRRWPRSAS